MIYCILTKSLDARQYDYDLKMMWSEWMREMKKEKKSDEIELKSSGRVPVCHTHIARNSWLEKKNGDEKGATER